MFNARDARSFDQFRIIRLVHVIERSGLAMAGAMSGTFVAAQLARIDVTPFESIGFIASMIVIGTIGFYLGIDIPRLPARASDRRRLDPVELLSAAGTFLAAIAALISFTAWCSTSCRSPSRKP